MKSPLAYLEKRLVPVSVIKHAKDAVPLAEALLAAGLNVIEVTLRTDAALEAMAAIRKSCPQMGVGAGTILDASVLPKLVDMGILFGVAPGLNPRLVEAAQKLNFPLMPGVITPTEIEQARGLGLDLLKFFPAEPAGGANMVKAVSGPYGHTGIKFVPTGGITADKVKEYLSIPTVAAIGGSWFVEPSMVEQGQFAEITRLTEQAVFTATVGAH